MKPPNCYLTADAVLIVGTEVLLVRRKYEPFQGKWALPGGFVEDGEKVIDAAIRELREETGIAHPSLSQLGAYGDPGRDPRGRVVSLVFWDVLPKKPAAAAGDDAADCAWFDFNKLPEMAFDHQQILVDLKNRVQDERLK